MSLVYEFFCVVLQDKEKVERKCILSPSDFYVGRGNCRKLSERVSVAIAISIFKEGTGYCEN